MQLYVGLFDGSNGSFAAEVVAREFHHALIDSMAPFDDCVTCTCTFDIDRHRDVTSNPMHSKAPTRFPGSR